MASLDDLLIKRRRGTLSEAEEQRLSAASSATREYELALLAGDVFEREGAAVPGDARRLRALVANGDRHFASLSPAESSPTGLSPGRFLARLTPRSFLARLTLRPWIGRLSPRGVRVLGVVPVFVAAVAAASVGGYRAFEALRDGDGVGVPARPVASSTRRSAPAARAAAAPSSGAPSSTAPSSAPASRSEPLVAEPSSSEPSIADLLPSAESPLLTPPAAASALSPATPAPASLPPEPSITPAPASLPPEPSIAPAPASLPRPSVARAPAPFPERPIPLSASAAAPVSSQRPPATPARALPSEPTGTPRRQPSRASLPHDATRAPLAHSSAPLAQAGAPAPLAQSSAPLAQAAPARAGDAETAQTLFRHANALRHTDWLAAAATYAELIRRHPASLEAGIAELALGKWSLAQGRSGDALEWFRAHQRRSQSALGAEALWGEARALESLGSRAAARVPWQALMDRYPDSPYAAVARERLERR